jgi:hypothetical protein
MSTDRKALFQQVAVAMLKTRSDVVIRATAQGTAVCVCPLFLKDVAIVAEAIQHSSEAFSTNVRTKTKEHVEAIVENHRELLSKLIDRPVTEDQTK